MEEGENQNLVTAAPPTPASEVPASPPGESLHRVKLAALTCRP